MPISTTPLYQCDSCDHSSSNPYQFRIIECRIKMGEQTLVRGFDFKPEVLCISCFCGAMGISIDCDDNFEVDNRFRHIHPSYEGDNKGRDTFNDDDFDDLDVPDEGLNNATNI